MSTEGFDSELSPPEMLHDALWDVLAEQAHLNGLGHYEILGVLAAIQADILAFGLHKERDE